MSQKNYGLNSVPRRLGDENSRAYPAGSAEILTRRLPLGVAGVFLANPQIMAVQRSDGLRGQIGVVLQLRIEGETDLIPVGDLAYGLAVIIKLRAFKVAEVADVVSRLVDAFAAQRRFAGRGQTRSAGKYQVEDDRSAVVGLTPYAEIAVELIAQAVGDNAGADG